MRIAMVVYAHYSRDARVRRYAESLAQKKHQVEIICLHENYQPADKNIRLIMFPLGRRRINLPWYFLEYRLENFVYPSFLLLEKYYPFSIPLGFLNKIKPLGNKLRLIKKLTSGNLLESEADQISAGRKRFSNIFFLSPQPLAKKLRVFFYPSVINSIIYIPYKMTVNFARRTYRKIFFFIKS